MRSVRASGNAPEIDAGGITDADDGVAGESREVVDELFGHVDRRSNQAVTGGDDAGGSCETSGDRGLHGGCGVMAVDHIGLEFQKEPETEGHAARERGRAKDVDAKPSATMTSPRVPSMA